MNFSQLYDISVSLSPEIAVWPGDPAIEITRASEIAKGADANVTRLNLGAHSATHMDAPVHFIEGTPGIDSFALDALVGTVQVLNMTGLETHIGAAHLEAASIPAGTSRVLFKTRNSQYWQTDPDNFHRDFIALAPDGAHWLTQHGVKLVGIDYLSIEQFDSAHHETHHILLAERVVIVEGLNLSEIEPGEYTLMALPLKIKNADGAPARVLLGR